MLVLDMFLGMVRVHSPRNLAAWALACALGNVSVGASEHAMTTERQCRFGVSHECAMTHLRTVAERAAKACRQLLIAKRCAICHF